MDTRAARRLWIDAVLAAIFTLVLLPLSLNGGLVDTVVLLTFSAALVVRRHAPAIALSVAWLAALLQMLLLREVNAFDVAALAVLYTTSAYGSRRTRGAGLVSAVVGAIVATVYLAVVRPAVITGTATAADADDTVVVTAGLLIGSLALMLLAWGAGMLARSRRSALELSRREEIAVRERGLAHYQMVVEQERARIARDMHDVVAHSLAVVIAQADGARFAAATRPDAAVGALTTIADVARGSLGEVRLLLDELRHTQSDGPQPMVSDLDSLLFGYRESGVRIELREHGERGTSFGASHQIAVYRIMQESLTNALKHGAPDQMVTVDLDWSSDEVLIVIANTVGPPNASGDRLHHGIAGMRERAELAGGHLSAGVESANVFVVRSQIPSGRSR